MDKMREEFERGMHNPHGWDMSRSGNSYDNGYVETMWLGFQRGYQAATAEAEKYRGAFALYIAITKGDIIFPDALKEADEFTKQALQKD